MKPPEILFVLHYSSYEEGFGKSSGGTEYGNKLLEPFVRLREELERCGYKVSTRNQSNIDCADVVVFLDMNAELWSFFQSLREDQCCILICLESPIYTPLSHAMSIVFNKRWDGVMTWNRSFQAKHIQYYDIPIAAVEKEQLDRVFESVRSLGQGVVVSSRKKEDNRGLLCERDNLYGILANKNEVDLYGLHWPQKPEKGMYGPSSDKIETLQKYSYSLIIENSLYPGYVTEKLADSISAGIPAIYYGDIKSAGLRFPSTFIPMEEISEEAFFRAKEKLVDSYEELIKGVHCSIVHSNLWCESFLSVFMETIEMAQQGKGKS